MIPYNICPSLVAVNAIGDGEDIRVMLLSPEAIIDLSHETKAEVGNLGEWEVSGNGWPASGYPLQNVEFIPLGEGVAGITSDVINFTSGGDVGPIRYAVLLLSSVANSPPLAVHDFLEEFTVYSSDPWVISWEDGYIFKIENKVA